MSQSTTLSSTLTAAQLAAMDGEQIVKMGRELIAQLGDDPERFHGNIWPGNIHFDEDGKAVLGDGSNAPVSERTPEQIEYMAPEAFWENRFGRDADLYSIALLMYTAYNGGRLPFTDSQAPKDTERAQALRTRMKGGEIPLPDGASEAVADILHRALRYETNGRYATSGSMLHDLSETDEALPSQAPEEEPVSDPQAAAAAAATGMAGVSLVSELASIPKEEVRPIEAEAGVSASSILMEQELRDIDRAESGAFDKDEPEPLEDIFAQPEPTKAETEPPEAAEPSEAEKTAETSVDAKASDAAVAEESATPPDMSAHENNKPKTPSKSGGKSKKKKKSAPKPVAGIVDLEAASEGAEAEASSMKGAQEQSASDEAAQPEVPQEAAVEPEVSPEKPEDTTPETAKMPQKTAPKKSAQTAKKSGQGAKKNPQTEKNSASTPSEKPAGTAEKKKQYTVQKDVDRREEAAVRRKNRRGAVVAIGVGVLVIAGLIGVTAYSLGAFEKEQPVVLVTAEPTTETTAAPTEPPVQEEEVAAVPEYHFTASVADFDWDELENVGLAVLDGQDAFDAAVAAAEEAELENAWIGARWLDAADAPDGEAGWYWLDGTQLPENSSFWAENEPSAGSGGRLMMRRMANGNWRFHAVTREQYESGEYEALGCITDGSGMAAIPTPAPTATPEPTPEPTQTPTNYSVYVPSYTTATAAPTTVPDGGSGTTTPSATATPEATAAPEKYLATRSDLSWSSHARSDLLALQGTTDFASVTEFLDAYNTAHADAPLRNVWLGAEYRDAEGERAAGWYWLDGTALSEQDNTHWAEGQTGESGSKLMLRYVDESWQFYAVSDTQYGDGTAYAHCGTLKLNPAAQ